MAEEQILVVDDDSLIRKSLYESLRLEGYEVATASDGAEAEEKLKTTLCQIVIADVKMPTMDGVELLRRIKKNHPETAVILITGFGSIESAVEAMKQGAADYITKPIVDDEIKLTIRRILEHRRLKEENKYLKKELSGRYQFHNLIGQDRRMQEIYTMIETVAETEATILIRGESGTGKRLIAHAIHFNDGSRRDYPFIELSCGALPDNLLESELFGHVRGAFTGAIRDKEGRFKLADKGTIFLDDIGTLSPALQVKLLRVLQNQEFEQVGGTKTHKVNVRVIAATNRDLEEAIKEKTFRQDLYYRLDVVSIFIPPLRKRMGDIPLLANHFLEKYRREAGSKEIKGISEEALKVMLRYNWPGNVRELENSVERAVILTKGPLITPGDLPKPLRKLSAQEKTKVKAASGPLKEALQAPEKDIILNVLNQTDWNRKIAADILNINRTTLYNKMKRFGLEKNKRQKMNNE
ncbi:MAG: sigma-54-dependent Fis family transcriptional regulator [Nitrospirae bacterium]|nr:sigma-54-dependent Fis family transcriptional regulator [Nitrospirota bacterium]